MLKEQKGITLVALVITIIVLLILAGVSISLVMGQNGVLTRASGAVVQNKIASGREKLESSVAAMEMNYKTEWAEDSAIPKGAVYAGVEKEDYDSASAPNLKAFQTELEANGLYLATGTHAGGVTGDGAADGIKPDVLKAGATETDVTSAETYFFTTKDAGKGDAYEVKMVIDQATGALYTEVLAWDGSAFSDGKN